MIRWLIHNKREQGLESLGDASSFGCDASSCCLHHDIVGHEAGPLQLARGGCEAHARQAWTRSRPGCLDGGGKWSFIQHSESRHQQLNRQYPHAVGAWPCAPEKVLIVFNGLGSGPKKQNREACHVRSLRCFTICFMICVMVRDRVRNAHTPITNH
jgi:hypothetical protein